MRITGLFKRKKNTTALVKKYLKFYYPSTSKVTYHIIFDWGEYVITTEDKADAEVHAHSKPYLGYITFRPMASNQFSDQTQPFYLVTPAGEVWENSKGKNIPKFNHREEVTKEKSAHGTCTKTLTIESISEPIIDHFKAYPEEWYRYGKLERRGTKTKLKLEKK